MLPLFRGSLSDGPARWDPPPVPAVTRSLSLRGTLGPYERLQRSKAFTLNTVETVSAFTALFAGPQRGRNPSGRRLSAANENIRCESHEAHP